MLVAIPEVLSAADVARCRAALEGAEWVDGAETAGAQAKGVKRNAQVRQGSAVGVELGNLILDRLGASAGFVSAALPLKTLPPLFNRYGQGQAFGAHVDNAIRRVPGTSIRLRTDLSATLFLSDPADYDGGELVIDGAFGVESVKLPAGDLILYPASSLHHVTPVTRGMRIASVFWVQSMVRDDGERALLFDLDQSVQTLTARLGANDHEVVRLSGLYHNLIRRWADA